MKCRYCVHFSDSEIRNDNGQRFCRSRAKMIYGDDDTCEKFDLTSTYRCRILQFDAGLEICVYRQSKDWADCKGCTQRKDILELRRWKGRQALIAQQSRPKTLIRREPCERTEMPL